MSSIFYVQNICEFTNPNLKKKNYFTSILLQILLVNVWSLKQSQMNHSYFFISNPLCIHIYVYGNLLSIPIYNIFCEDMVREIKKSRPINKFYFWLNYHLPRDTMNISVWNTFPSLKYYFLSTCSNTSTA